MKWSERLNLQLLQNKCWFTIVEPWNIIELELELELESSAVFMLHVNH